MTFDELNSIQVELVSPNIIQFPTRVHPIPENKNGILEQGAKKNRF